MLITWIGRLMEPLYDEDGKGGGGSSEREKLKGSDLVDQYKAQYGEQALFRMAERAANAENDNYQARERARKAEEKVAALEAKQVPDGATVLNATDAERWQAYQALGKPDEIKTRLDDGAAAVTERDGLKRKETLRQVAEAAGYKPAVLERLGSDLTYEIKDVTEMVNGRQVQARQVLVQDGDKQTPLKDYAAREWEDFLPALGGTEQPLAHGTPRREPVVAPMAPPDRVAPIPGIRL